MIEFSNLKFKVVEEKGNLGKFEIGPLPRGYGYTVGNGLRRMLLSSIPGAAVTSVKIKGVKHEYSTISGVKEDVLLVVLRLKRLALISHSNKPVELTLKAKGKKIVTAGDIEKSSEVEVVNKDLEIATLTESKAKLEMDLTVEQGVGYSLPDESRRSQIGVLPLDGNFSPVKRVKLEVTGTRVGQRTDFDQVDLEVETNGAMSPTDALVRSIETGKALFDLMLKVVSGEDVEETEEEITSKQAEARTLLTDVKLSNRARNSLQRGGITTLEEVTKMTREETANLKGMGEKSLKDIGRVLEENGMKFREEE